MQKHIPFVSSILFPRGQRDWGEGAVTKGGKIVCQSSVTSGTYSVTKDRERSGPFVSACSQGDMASITHLHNIGAKNKNPKTPKTR